MVTLRPGSRPCRQAMAIWQPGSWNIPDAKDAAKNGACCCRASKSLGASRSRAWTVFLDVNSCGLARLTVARPSWMPYVECSLSASPEILQTAPVFTSRLRNWPRCCADGLTRSVCIPESRQCMRFCEITLVLPKELIRERGQRHRSSRYAACRLG